MPAIASPSHKPSAADLGELDDGYVPLSTFSRAANLVAVIVPFLGLIAAMILLWGWGIGWVELSTFLGMYVITSLGITVGYHRLLTHRSFETGPVVRFVLAVMGSMAAQGPVLQWVATHRRHHQHSDGRDDPHTPHHNGHGLRGLIRGAWHSHLGWMFTPVPVNMMRYVRDLKRSRTLAVVDALFPLWVALGLAIPAAIGGLVTETWAGVLLGFLWGGLARLFLVHHVTWSINSVCHLWGGRPYPSGDQSRNNFVFGVLAMGEGWHNNHHAFPTSARHGLRWWQFDASYILIRALVLSRLAWKVKLPDLGETVRRDR